MMEIPILNNIEFTKEESPAGYIVLRVKIEAGACLTISPEEIQMKDFDVLDMIACAKHKLFHTMLSEVFSPFIANINEIRAQGLRCQDMDVRSKIEALTCEILDAVEMAEEKLVEGARE